MKKSKIAAIVCLIVLIIALMTGCFRIDVKMPDGQNGSISAGAEAVSLGDCDGASKTVMRA